jgi:hypothetical protein
MVGMHDQSQDTPHTQYAGRRVVLMHFWLYRWPADVEGLVRAYLSLTVTRVFSRSMSQVGM